MYLMGMKNLRLQAGAHRSLGHGGLPGFSVMGGYTTTRCHHLTVLRVSRVKSAAYTLRDLLAVIAAAPA